MCCTFYLQRVIAEGRQDDVSAVTSQIAHEDRDIRPRAGIRPLTAAYRATSSQNDVSCFCLL